MDLTTYDNLPLARVERVSPVLDGVFHVIPFDDAGTLQSPADSFMLPPRSLRLPRLSPTGDDVLFFNPDELSATEQPTESQATPASGEIICYQRNLYYPFRVKRWFRQRDLIDLNFDPQCRKLYRFVADGDIICTGSAVELSVLVPKRDDAYSQFDRRDHPIYQCGEGNRFELVTRTERRSRRQHVRKVKDPRYPICCIPFDTRLELQKQHGVSGFGPLSCPHRTSATT